MGGDTKSLFESGSCVNGEPDDYIEAVVQIVMQANWHTHQILTKRGDRMRDLLDGKLNDAARQSHIWWGVSVENGKHGLPRIVELRDSPARVRFLSIEPLLEDLGRINLRGIHWVIVGGESGAGARAMSAEWVRGIKDQCRKANVPFFFKQWGGVRKSETGRELDGRTYSQFPERDETPASLRQKKGFRVEALREDLHRTQARVSPQMTRVPVWAPPDNTRRIRHRRAPREMF